MKSKRSRLSIPFVAIATIIGVVAPAQLLANAIQNGDFATGDLTGWTASAIDFDGNAVTPLIEVVDLGGVNSAVFSTGTFADGPFISTLEQTFTLTVDEPVLSFDFSLPTVTPDSTGTGQSLFFDTLFVSIQNGGSRDLLLVIKDGAFPDPFGTAPGTVALGPSQFPVMMFNCQADLSALAGSSVTLFIDVINEDDGFVSVFDPGPFFTQAPGSSKLPETNRSSWLLLISLSALIFPSLLKTQVRSHENHPSPSLRPARPG